MRNSSPAPDVDSDPQQISAYYSLIFPNFTFYLQTINCTIGRKTAVGSSSGAGRVDVDLGPLKSVSRLHARIEYDSDIERFVLAVIGRNGAWVDGVWASAGSRIPLGEHSQIQIASRTFHFMLPPAPPQPVVEEEPRSPSRSRSPSLIDVTTELPRPETPPPLPPSPPKAKPITVPKVVKSDPAHTLPNTNSIKPKQNPNSKRYSRPNPEERPRPEDIPPKPSLTYAQLIYRALKGIGGKATLQEICAWVSDTYEYYKWADPQWMSSIRHNLSSGRAFKKLERCGGDRGKGFFWTLDEEQDFTALEGEAKSTESKQKKKGKPVDQKRNGAKLDSNGSYSLPPPLTTRPLEFKAAAPKPPAPDSPTEHQVPPMASLQPPSTDDTTPSVSYTSQPQLNLALGAVKSEYSGTPLSVPNPYAPRQANSNGTTGWHYTGPIPIQPQTVQPSHHNLPAPPSSTQPSSASSSSKAQAQATVNQVSDSISFLEKDARVPIVVGPPPSSYQPPSQSTPSTTSDPSSSTASVTVIPPMLLHESTIYLAPEMFSSLDRQALDAIEALGVQQALELLRGHLARYLKQKMGKRSRGEKKKKSKMVNGDKDGGSNISPLITTGPSEKLSQPPAVNGDAHDTSIKKDGDEDEIVIIDDSSDGGPSAKKRKIGTT